MGSAKAIWSLYSISKAFFQFNYTYEGLKKSIGEYLDEKNIDFIQYFGGGHVATSNALLEALKNENDYQITAINLSDEMRALSSVLDKIILDAIYYMYNTIVLQKNFLALHFILFYFIYCGIKMNKKNRLENIIDIWEKYQPDLVISVIPFINELVYDSLKIYNKKILFFVLVQIITKQNLLFGSDIQVFKLY